jgi:alpha-mannosidase
VSAGRVEIGPWYTLPDEFCVSGETLVRDLQLGFDRAASLGGAMEVGYLPDMFGHVAQMPQILRLFGLDRAVVWRGVPEAVDRTRLWWTAPDGSTVRAEYLWSGYSVGASVVEPVRAGPEPHALTNGIVAIVADGCTFSVNGVPGFGRLVESGDHGDTYNYCPPDHDLVVRDPARTVVRLLETGPVLGRIEIVALYEWPRQVDDATHERVGLVPSPITTVLELRAGEPWVRVSHQWDNQSRDHRVRALLPLPHPSATSGAECAFGVVERQLRGEGGPMERAMGTYPSRRFVRADDLTVVHDGLLEYELVGEDGLELPAGATTGRAIALTLLRSTGMLSRVDLPYRPVSAGPPVPTPGAQLEGATTASYAVTIDPYAMADDVLIPLRTSRVRGGGPITDDRCAGLIVEGAEVSALRRERGALTVRVFNPGPTTTMMRIGGRRGWVEDLRGRPQAAFSGAMELGPFQIVTVRLDGERGRGGDGIGPQAAR